MRPSLRVLLAALGVGALLSFLDLQWLDTYHYSIASPDFFVYYLAAQVGSAHGWASIYDPSVFLPLQTPAVPRPLPYLNPPELAWLVLPLSWLPYNLAAWVWKFLLLTALAVTCYLTVAGSPARKLLHGAAAALLLPVFISIVFGQVSVIIALAVALAWWLMVRGHPWLAGMCLAAIFLKPQAAFLVPAGLLAAGYWRVFLAWLATSAVLAAVTVGVVGRAALGHVMESMSLQHSLPGPIQISVERQFPVEVAVPLVGLVLIALIASSIRSRASGPELPVAAGLIGSVLISPYINFYDLSGLLLAGWLILRATPRWQVVFAFGMYLPIYLAPLIPAFSVICLLLWQFSLVVLPANRRHRAQPRQLVGAEAA
jgi:hypothetical protein